MYDLGLRIVSRLPVTVVPGACLEKACIYSEVSHLMAGWMMYTRLTFVHLCGLSWKPKENGPNPERTMELRSIRGACTSSEAMTVTLGSMISTG